MAMFDVALFVSDYVSVIVDAEDADDARMQAAEIRDAMEEELRYVGETVLMVKGHEVIVYPSVEVVGVSEYE